ncbi:hypothetical protein QEZ40_005231 [Streptomyces katrae]|uniref:Uncharacterized protein n=1 Tax=Streptomyces katrae TaxID=68223 RepID=A0ABT7H1M7_9ACTN|nr:hypothetical protein [Streptomyces katrae]MDK9499796.1 hypothetical protein [Streptomyces katrae]
MTVTDDEKALLETLLRHLDRVPPLGERTGGNWSGWRVHPGSPLAGDDKKTDPYHLSHSAHLAIVVAVDHLQALATLVKGQEKAGVREMLIHTHAPFTLLRAALENAARAVWLLGPLLRRERVWRRLVMQFADTKNGEAKAKMLGASWDGEPTRERIRRLLKDAGVPECELSNKKLKLPGYGDLVNSAGRFMPLGGERAELFWSACSSLAHGDLSGTLAFLDREVTATDGTISLLRLTGSVRALLVITVATLDVVEYAFGLYGRRAAAPY